MNTHIRSLQRVMWFFSCTNKELNTWSDFSLEYVFCDFYDRLYFNSNAHSVSRSAGSFTFTRYYTCLLALKSTPIFEILNYMLSLVIIIHIIHVLLLWPSKSWTMESTILKLITCFTTMLSWCRIIWILNFSDLYKPPFPSLAIKT